MILLLYPKAEVLGLRLELPVRLWRGLRTRILPLSLYDWWIRGSLVAATLLLVDTAGCLLFRHCVLLLNFWDLMFVMMVLSPSVRLICSCSRELVPSMFMPIYIDLLVSSFILFDL